MNAVLSYDISLNHILICAVMCSNGSSFNFSMSFYSDLSFDFVRMLNLGKNMFRLVRLVRDLSASGMIYPLWARLPGLKKEGGIDSGGQLFSRNVNGGNTEVEGK